MDHQLYTVLVADDNYLVRQTNEMILRAHGFKVADGASSRSHLERALETMTPHLIVSDIDMPYLNEGIDFVRALRERGSEIPVILVSGRGVNIAQDTKTWQRKMYEKDEYWVVREDMSKTCLLHKPYNPATLIHLARALVLPTQ
ncbi:response regulator [Candidatus Pacearchaeota archaeon]|nr:response regulator [Candidatus Pacearchaeota archaeon]